MSFKNFVSFLKYNNAVPITISVLILGASSTFAATNPEVFVEEEQEVLSIDNSYIANKDLSKYSPSVTVTSVMEDAENYYITYTFKTIDLYEYVWQDIEKQGAMTVSKASLGAYRDLGLYVAEQLNEIIAQESRRLRETQVFEKASVTKKKVATKYKGIIGGFLDAKTEEFDNYRPVVVPPEPEEEQETFAYPPDPEDIVTLPPVEEVIDNKPRVTILGDTVVRLTVGDIYTDLGAIADDTEDGSLPVSLLLDGVSVDSITIDTSSVRTYTITYVAVDSQGKQDEEIRTVEINAQENSTPEPEEDTPEEPIVEIENPASSTTEENVGTSTDESLNEELPIEDQEVQDNPEVLPEEPVSDVAEQAPQEEVVQ